MLGSSDLIHLSYAGSLALAGTAVACTCISSCRPAAAKTSFGLGAPVCQSKPALQAPLKLCHGPEQSEGRRAFGGTCMRTSSADHLVEEPLFQMTCACVQDPGLPIGTHVCGAAEAAVCVVWRVRYKCGGQALPVCPISAHDLDSHAVCEQTLSEGFPAPVCAVYTVQMHASPNVPAAPA